MQMLGDVEGAFAVTQSRSSSCLFEQCAEKAPTFVLNEDIPLKASVPRLMVTRRVFGVTLKKPENRLENT